MKFSDFGLRPVWPQLTTAYSAIAPVSPFTPPTSAHTSSPTARWLQAPAVDGTLTTVPLRSIPSVPAPPLHPMPNSMKSTSHGLTDEPSTLTSTWPAPGVGVGTVRVPTHLKGVKQERPVLCALVIIVGTLTTAAASAGGDKTARSSNRCLISAGAALRTDARATS